MRPLLSDLVGKVFRETTIRQELIHKVCLGPFTHTVDDGLDARKAAFECLDTLVDKCGDYLDPAAIFECLLSGVRTTLTGRALFGRQGFVSAGVKDEYDIKMLCHLILVKFARKQPFTVLGRMQIVTESLEKTLKTKDKSSATKNEVCQGTARMAQPSLPLRRFF